MSSLITSDQLSSAISKVRAFIESKFGTSANAKFGTVGVGSADIDYIDSEHSVIISGEPNAGTTMIPLGSHTETTTVAVVDNDGVLPVDTLQTDLITDGTKVYALPNSSSTANGGSVDPISGGGTILTSRYRSYAKVVTTLSTMSSVIVYPGTYHIIQAECAVGLSLPNPNTNILADEYWVDIEFLVPIPPINPNIGVGVVGPSPSYTPGIIFGDHPYIFVGGEPDWGSLLGKRLQLHIIHDTIHYTVIEPNNNTEE